MTELVRQQQLLADLRADDPRLRAYRANADATAARALAAAFPTLNAMLGEAGFAAAARALWHEQPPERGDLAEWGGSLPAWIEAQPSLGEWPWLADSARLDWAVHRCERAADACFDAASLRALTDTDPARLQLQLMPGSALVESRWPIVTLHAAHAVTGDAALARAQEALAAGGGEAALVVRAGWRALVRAVNTAQRPWLRSVLAGHSLAAALGDAGADFDFAAWLAEAVAGGWLKGLVVDAD